MIECPSGFHFNCHSINYCLVVYFNLFHLAFDFISKKDKIILEKSCKEMGLD